jgi:hypothetical protein
LEAEEVLKDFLFFDKHPATVSVCSVAISICNVFFSCSVVAIPSGTFICLFSGNIKRQLFSFDQWRQFHTETALRVFSGNSTGQCFYFFRGSTSTRLLFFQRQLDSVTIFISLMAAMPSGN